MRLSLWQQFSSNHSSSFTVVGEFATPEKLASDYGRTARFLLQIHEWRSGVGGKKINLREFLSPPEQIISSQYPVGGTTNRLIGPILNTLTSM
ncbi:MAG: hypothetical protein U0694_13215 [Anaerolineae bacterium]